MKRLFFILVAIGALTACKHTIYVVRHAEKAIPSAGITMSSPNNPPLSELGRLRAEALARTLTNARIRHIFSTNTTRTLSTAEPLSQLTCVRPEVYEQVTDEFVVQLKNLHDNTLVVAHSNTIDDLVNRITGTVSVPGDLPDSSYDHLYVLKVGKRKVLFEDRRYVP